MDGKPVLQATYSDIISDFGEPEEIKYYDVTRDIDGGARTLLGVMCYKDIQFELFDVGAGDEDAIKNEPVMRFDITGSKYSFMGITVGMTTKEFSELYSGLELFDTGILELTTEEMEDQKEQAEQRLCAGELWSAWKSEIERRTALVFTTAQGSILSPQTVYNHYKKLAL